MEGFIVTLAVPLLLHSSTVLGPWLAGHIASSLAHVQPTAPATALLVSIGAAAVYVAALWVALVRAVRLHALDEIFDVMRYDTI